MPIKNDSPTQYTPNGAPANHSFFRRLNRMLFLSIGSVLLIIAIIAALVVFTFLPIFSATKGEQTKYQARSGVLKLIYNLPSKSVISAANWTYEENDLEFDKLMILQNLFQNLLNSEIQTRKTSIAIIDAFITAEDSPIRNAPFGSPVALDRNNNSLIILTQTDNSAQSNGTVHLVISLRLRYSLECATNCQNNMRQSIFSKTLRNLQMPLETFQTLFISNTKTTTTTLLSSSTLTTTAESTKIRSACTITTTLATLVSLGKAGVNYEAESLLNRFHSTTRKSCNECSGEQKVSDIGFANELTFQQIVSQHGGQTIVLFHFVTDKARSAHISVNEVLPPLKVLFPKTPGNQQIGLLPITLNLCQGFNTIRVYNPDDHAPDLDRIVVY